MFRSLFGKWRGFNSWGLADLFTTIRQYNHNTPIEIPRAHMTTILEDLALGSRTRTYVSPGGGPSQDSSDRQEDRQNRARGTLSTITGHRFWWRSDLTTVVCMYMYLHIMIRELEKWTYVNRKQEDVIPTSKMKMYYHRRQFPNSKPHLSDFGYAAWQPAMPHTESVSFHLWLCQCSAESRATHHRECETRMKRSSWCKSRCPPGVEIPTPFQSGQRNWEVFKNKC